MILRLRRYRLSLKVAIYGLPVVVFGIGWCVWTFVSMALRRPALYAPGGYFTQIAFGTVVWAFLAEHYRVASFDELFRERTGARAAWSACMATASVLLATLYFSRNATFPRGLLICDMILLLAFTILLHAVFRILCRSRANFAKPTRLLVVGADEFAHEAAAKLQRLVVRSVRHRRLCASAGPGDICQRRPDLRAGTTRHDQFRTRHRRGGDRHSSGTILANSEDPQGIGPFMPAGESCRRSGRRNCRARKTVSTRQCADAGLDINADGIPGLCFTQTGFRYMFFRNRLAAHGSLIRTDRGDHSFDVAWSDFFQAGDEWDLMEGHSTCTSSERCVWLRKAQSDTLWTNDEDSRERCLDRYSAKRVIDELPQFINVLNGDMSVVGPRPERPHFVQKFLQEVTRYNNRHALKVGITGWAQVNGLRGDTSIEKRVEYDLYYLQNWSLAFDLRIIAMTIISGLINRNAY